MIGFAISGVALSISIFFEPRFMFREGIIVLAPIAGLNEAIIHRNKKEMLLKRTLKNNE